MSQFARENPDDPFGNMPWHIRAQYETAAREVTTITAPAAERTLETALDEMQVAINALECVGEDCGNGTCTKMRLDTLLDEVRFRSGLKKPYL